MIRMLTRSCWQSVPAILVAVLAISSAPEQAKASCGDYVVMGNQPAMSDHQPVSDHGSGPIQPPCHGPNCSHSPQTPVVPLAPVVAPVFEDTLCALLKQPIQTDPDESFGFRDVLSIRPIFGITDIFHPPRFATV
jgi:hypothetical protein